MGILAQQGEVDEVQPLREVLDVDVLLSVRSSLTTAEQQGFQLLLCSLPGCCFDLNLLDLEAEDDDPDEAEDRQQCPRLPYSQVALWCGE